MYLPKQITLSWSTGSKFKACIHYISCYVSRKMARGSRLIWIGRPITLQLFKLYMQSMVISYTLKNKGASRCHRLGYKKFGNSLELSYSTVARVIQRFSKTGFTRNRHCKGRIKEVKSLCFASGAESGFKKQTHECCQHCFRGCRSRRSACQCSDHTPHTSTSRFAWLSSQKEASSEAGSQKSLQTICWRHPGQEHELLEPCPVVWWVEGKLVWLRWCSACVAMPWWGVPRKLCLAYSQAWWW